MKLFSKSADGGGDSGVTGYFLIECKPLFSIVLLHFQGRTREAFHSHAFSALTLWLKGTVKEERYPRYLRDRTYRPGMLKWTRRADVHRVQCDNGSAWAISFRGPWATRWYEVRNSDIVVLAHGRREVRG